MHSARNRVIDTGITLAASAAVLLLALSSFILNGESLIWSADGLTQHYPSLYFFNDWIRGIIQNPGQGVPLWSWTIGLGADIISSLSYYAVGDPFALISLAFPMSQIAVAYQVALVARVLCAAVFSALYLRAMGARNVPALIGALLYTFSGFMLCNGFRHPIFVTAMVFLPLLLLGAEHALRSRRPWLLTAVVFLSAVGNFYFFYILTIITVLYTVARYFETTERELRWRQLVPVGLRIAGFYSLGILLAAPLLFPTIAAIRDTARAQSSYSYGLLYSLADYQNILADLASVRTFATASFMGFVFVGIALVPVLYMRPGRSALKFLIAAYAVFIALPVFGSIFNGFTFPLGRFAFSLGLFLGLATALVLSEDRPFSRREVLGIAAGYAVYVALLLVLDVPRDLAIAVPVVVGALVVVIAAFDAHHVRTPPRAADSDALADRWRAPLVQWALLGLVVLTVAANAAVLYDPRLQPADFKTGFIKNAQLQRTLNTDTSVLAGQSTAEGFFRVDDRNASDVNSSMLQGYSGTGFYLSVMNGGLSVLRSELGLSTAQPPSASINGFDDRAMLDALVSAKYYVTSAKDAAFAPYGYSQVGRRGDALAYRTENALPLGFVYGSTIARSAYDDLSALDKQSALLQGAVVEDGEAPDVPRVQPRSEAIELPYTVSSTRGLKFDRANRRIERGAHTSTFTASFKPVPDSELYVEIDGFNDDNLSKAWKLQTEYTAGGLSKAQSLHTSRSPYAWGPALQVANLGYWKQGIDRITLQFVPKGTLTFKSLKVFALPMRDFAARVASLKSAPLRDVAIGTNTVTGTVSSAGPGLLFLSIPYSSGWSATVDGAPAKIVRTNTAFSGIPVSSGTHSVRLSYETPWLRLGFITAGIAILIMASIAVADAVARRRPSRVHRGRSGPQAD